MQLNLPPNILPEVRSNVEVSFIPRSRDGEAKVRLLIFRKEGSAILDVDCSAIALIKQPVSETGEDVLQAFRECVPLLARSLNKTISTTPPGEVIRVTAKMVRQIIASEPSPLS